MKQLYGTSFLTVYGEKPSSLWVFEIAQLTDDDCRSGLRRLAKERREYPANLTEFLEAARPRSKGITFLGRPVGPDYLLGIEKAPREVAAKRIANMRETLRRANAEPELPQISPAETPV